MKTKRLLIFLLVSLFILTSCSDKSKIETPENDDGKEQLGEEIPAAEVSEKVTDEVPNAWNLNLSKIQVNVPYKVPEFTPNVGKYKVNEDLSNLFNAGQYEGFTKEQIQAIYEDGFVIMEPSYRALKLHHVYEWPIYKESPVFITVDSALHLYHIYYDKSLKYVESSLLYDKLDFLSRNLLMESIKAFSNPDFSSLKEELKFVAAYFLTASKILGSDSGIMIPEEVSSIADKEIMLIEEASDFSKSPLLGTDLDYSQFTVRGHYTGNEKLEKYFKAMMWYGLCGFSVFDENIDVPTLNMDSLTKGMLITCLALKNEENFKAYENIYSITSLYTGMSDDLGVIEFRDLITKVYGQNPDLKLLKDDTYHQKLLEEALKLPEPKIKPKTTLVNLPAGRQFRFMGQRYSFDAEVLQNLMEPIIRPVPSGLDVVAAFGSIRAEELLDTYYEPKKAWNKYEEILNKMREKNHSLSDDEWKADLYKGWLWSIKSSAASFEDIEGMPQFMRSKKWTDKNIHTALGSYAELKHDSILYMKQPVAEMGGGGDISIPYNYVEPNVEVYAKLKWLAENTKAQLKARGMLDEENARILDMIIEMQTTLLNVSVKELTNQNISEEENMILYAYGGRIDSIIQSLNAELMNEGIDTSGDITSALVADIATVAPNNYYLHGKYLEVGNGLPLEVYIVCETNGKLYLAKGALFNYYEFLSDKRLTDDEWQKMIGIKKVKWVYDKSSGIYVEDFDGNVQVDENTDYFEEVSIIRPMEMMISKPEWTKSFMTPGENYVTIVQDMELDWWE